MQKQLNRPRPMTKAGKGHAVEQLCARQYARGNELGGQLVEATIISITTMIMFTIIMTIG